MAPYIGEQVRRATQSGEPIMKPLFFDYPSDAATYPIRDEWLLGDSLPATYEVAVSADSVRWRTEASGQFVNDQTEKDVDFTPTRGEFLRFTAHSEVTGDRYTSMAELTPLH